MNISRSHPRFESLQIREKLVAGMKMGVVVPEGLLAHGRGEAFDYVMGERTLTASRQAIRCAAAQLLLANHPVISVNGNVAALVPTEVAQLAHSVPARVEVNLFHRTKNRESQIGAVLERNGVNSVFGLGSRASQRIRGVASKRKMVDPSGIGNSDVVLVPLEDGDRVSALRKTGKTVIAIDLNPLSRTARTASVTIVDNIVRALPSLVRQVRASKRTSRAELEKIIEGFDNERNLGRAVQEIVSYLKGWRRS